MTAHLPKFTMCRRSFVKGLSVAALSLNGGTLTGGNRALASDWPARNVTIVVPYSAGGNSDLLARLMAQYLSEKTSKTFVVENRPGGGGVAASSAVADSRPDGCTVLFGPPASIIITPLLQKVSYTSDSFNPINNFAGYPYLLGVRPNAPFKSVAELIAYGKDNPGKLNYATAGVGAMSHLVTALFLSKVGVSAVMVPYKSSMQSTGAVMAGETDFVFSSTADLMPYMTPNDRIRIIATTSEKRLADFSDLPAVQETVPGFAIGTWNGVLGPRGMPPDIVNQFATLIRDAVTSATVTDRLKNLGVYPIPATPLEFSATIASDKVFVTDALKVAGLT